MQKPVRAVAAYAMVGALGAEVAIAHQPDLSRCFDGPVCAEPKPDIVLPSSHVPHSSEGPSGPVGRMALTMINSMTTSTR